MRFSMSNNGSTDIMLEKLQAIAETASYIKVINLSRNFGKEVATAAGVEAKGQGSPIEIAPIRIAMVSQAVDLNPNTRSQIG